MTDVEHMWQHAEVRTFLLTGDDEDGQGAGDAVAYPFTYSEHTAHDWPVVCAVCGQIVVADETFRAYVESAFAQYLETALWSSLDYTDVDDVEVHNPEPMDARFSVDDLSDDLRDLDAEQTGHDFWLTRNGHGAGFWDRGLGEVGDRLTSACRPYGEVDLYVGDDGDLYV
jgi:hypothetical protein